MTHEYTTRGTCSRKILFEVEDGKVHNVQFISGCSGNTQGVAKLCEGMDVNEVIDRPLLNGNFAIYAVLP